MLDRPRLSPLTVIAVLLLVGLSPPLLAGTGETDPESPERVAPATSPSEFAGHWEGVIETPSVALAIRIDLARQDDAWSGTFDSPDQGATGVPLADIRTEGDRIEFAIRAPGEPSFAGRLVEGRIEGAMTQFGQTMSFRLGREKTVERGRPQEPTSPLPYEQEPVALDSGSVTLAGTLTLPAGEGPFPAALLLSGSGAQDRDETIFGHRPFLVLADHLTRAGIAVLRLDDRGVGGSGGALASCTLETLAQDALAAVRFLGQRPEIDAKRVGLIGHSEGGVVAPLAASRSTSVAFVVMLAGSGVPGHEILSRQLDLILRVGGLDEERRATILAEQRKLIDLVLGDAEPAALRKQFRALTEAQIGAVPGAPAPDDEALDLAAEQGVAQLTSPIMRDFLRYDPAPALRKIRVPLLALFGELDLQVDARQNLPPVRDALQATDNDDVTLKTLAGLNHLLQTATTGATNEYASIEETISPKALLAIGEWILARFATPGTSGP